MTRLWLPVVAVAEQLDAVDPGAALVALLALTLSGFWLLLLLRGRLLFDTMAVVMLCLMTLGFLAPLALTLALRRSSTASGEAAAAAAVAVARAASAAAGTAQTLTGAGAPGGAGTQQAVPSGSSSGGRDGGRPGLEAAAGTSSDYHSGQQAYLRRRQPHDLSAERRQRAAAGAHGADLGLCGNTVQYRTVSEGFVNHELSPAVTPASLRGSV